MKSERLEWVALQVVPRPFALAVIVLATGCGGADSLTPTPVDTSEVLAAFAAVDPVRLQLDIRNDSYFGVLPATFVPESWPDVPDSPFEIDLFADADGARASSAEDESVAGEDPEIVLHTNVRLVVAHSVARERRDRLVSALKSL